MQINQTTNNMKAKILTLLTFMVMTCMSLTSMAQEPILILVEENGNEVTQPSQESSFSFPQEETTTTTTTTEPSSFNSSVTHLEEEVLTLTFEDEDASAAKAAEEARRAEEARLAEEARRAEEARLAEEARRAEEARLAEEARRAEEARLAKEKAAAQTEQVKPTQPTTEEQNLEERVATAVAAEARALEAAAKAEEAAKKATEEREKIEALQNAQGMPAQTEQQVQPTAQLPKAVQDLEAATDTVPAKQTVRERYYKKSGTNFLSIVSVGYSTVFLTPNRMDGLTHTEFAGKRHFINFEILEWRAKLFGMQLFNFEIGVNTPGWTEGGTNLTKLMSGGEYNKIGYGSGLKEADARTMWFAYKPAIKLYIPCSDWLAIELYGGMEIDLTTAWSKINPLYYRYNKDIPGLNYFLGAYGGLGLMLTPAPAVPIEIKAEYRHPVQGNMDIVPQGFYLSTQLHLGVPIRKTHKNKK